MEERMVQMKNDAQKENEKGVVNRGVCRDL